MIYYILFAIYSVGLIALGLSLYKTRDRVDVCISSIRRHERLFTDVDLRRTTDLCELDKAVERIQELENRLEAHAAELTEHHNKIDTLEINGTVYEGLFEQQGLRDKEEDSEPLEFLDPEDEGIII